MQIKTEEWIKSFLESLEVERNLSEFTIRNYRHYLKRFSAWWGKQTGKTDVTALTLEDVRQFRLYLSRLSDKREKKLSKVTQAYHVIALRSWLKWLIKQDVRVLAPEKIDVPKGDSRSLIWLTREQVARLLAARYLATRADNWPPLFVRYAGGKPAITSKGEEMRLTVRSVQRLVKKYVRKVQLPVVATVHTLRHSFATDLLQSGAGLREVQELLGHKNIATTQVYTHVTNPQLRAVHEKYHSGNRE